ncbi:MAG: ABC transporter permease [Bacilli bacterium]|nr:ABC transporter permease [Bacilli bacterium]
MFTFSEEHTLYIKQLKKERRIILFGKVFLFIIFLSFWEILAQKEILNTFLYSSPSKILSTIKTLLINGQLGKHIWITTYEVGISFLLSSIGGIFIAFLLWRFEKLAKILDPYITILNSLPKVALGPLIIIWVGADIHSIICMALLISIFTTIISIYTSFISTPMVYLILFKSLHASSIQTFWKLILPYNIENIIAALKVNISMSLVGVIMGELLVSKKGLGYLIMYGSQIFQLDLVITSIFILGVLSYIMYIIIDYVQILLKKKEKYN